MMRPHCDRCDKLCDEYPTWVEDTSLAASSALKGLSTDLKSVWHIHIDAGGNVSQREEKMFCRACRIAILEAHVGGLKAVKSENGHLADCRWDNGNKRYVCADGCEIKKFNDIGG